VVVRVMGAEGSFFRHFGDFLESSREFCWRHEAGGEGGNQYCAGDNKRYGVRGMVSEFQETKTVFLTFCSREGE